MSHDLMPINKPEPGSYDFREVMEIVQEILVSNRDVLATLEEAISAIEMELRDMET